MPRRRRPPAFGGLILPRTTRPVPADPSLIASTYAFATDGVETLNSGPPVATTSTVTWTIPIPTIPYQERWYLESLTLTSPTYPGAPQIINDWTLQLITQGSSGSPGTPAVITSTQGSGTPPAVIEIDLQNAALLDGSDLRPKALVLTYQVNQTNPPVLTVAKGAQVGNGITIAYYVVEAIVNGVPWGVSNEVLYINENGPYFYAGNFSWNAFPGATGYNVYRTDYWTNGYAPPAGTERWMIALGNVTNFVDNYSYSQVWTAGKPVPAPIPSPPPVAQIQYQRHIKTSW